MAFSYDIGRLDLALNQVRLMVGDTNANEPLMQDEEVTFVQSTAGSNIYAAAAAVARFIAAKLAKDVDSVNEPLRQMFSARMNRYLKLADIWEQQVEVGATGGAALSAWTGLVPGSGERSTPAFYRGVASDPVNDAAAFGSADPADPAVPI